MVFRRADTRRAERKAAYPHEDEPEVAVTEAEVIEETPPPPPPEPVVLPEWKGTVQPNKAPSGAEKTVEQWIIEGITKIADEHKLAALSAWRDPAGNIKVEFIPDQRAMYALRKK